MRRGRAYLLPALVAIQFITLGVTLHSEYGVNTRLKAIRAERARIEALRSEDGLAVPTVRDPSLPDGTLQFRWGANGTPEAVEYNAHGRITNARLWEVREVPADRTSVDLSTGLTTDPQPALLASRLKTLGVTDAGISRLRKEGYQIRDDRHR